MFSALLLILIQIAVLLLGTDDELAERVRELGREVVNYVFIEPCPPTMETEENVGAVD